MKHKMLLITMLLLLLFVQGVQAMESANYSLNWYTPLDTGGGGTARSAHYTADITIGQTSIGPSNSSNYRIGLGYWYGLVEQIGNIFNIQLPLITK